MASVVNAARLALLSAANKSKIINLIGRSRKYATTTESGAFLDEPNKVPMGLYCIVGTMSTGLLLGAVVSKNVASFLEENELFVPSDDDDDD